MSELVRVEAWYSLLVEDVRSLEFQGIVMTKHAIGKRILEDELKFGKPEYGEKRIEGLAKELDVSQWDLYKCIQFARKYPEFCDVSHNLSWYEITHNLLASPKKKALVESIEELPEGFVTSLSDLNGQKFGCVYADPPWRYSNQATRGSTDNHYPTLTVDEICALPVGEHLTESAHLHLWTTNAFLFDCQRIFDAWGFEFKSSFVWVKPQIGMGNYWRNAHEFLLLGVRGGLTAQARDVKSWIEAKRTTHSTKPEVVRECIERLSPGPYLELFGRRKVDGWMVMGNELVASNKRFQWTG